MSATFAERMACGDTGCLAEKMPDWGPYAEHLPGRVRMSDIDGVLSNIDLGTLLFVEWKGRADATVRNGQRYMLSNLSRREGVTVLVVYADGPRTPRSYRTVTDGRWSREVVCDAKLLAELIGGWWRTGAWPEVLP